MDFTECYLDTVSSVAAAARSGDRRSLRKLILRGCSLDCRDNRGWTPLHEAAAAGSARCVREILSSLVKGSVRSSRDLVNFQTHEGETACFLAAQHGHVSVVRLLHKAGADIDKQTNNTSCPLFAAVDGGHRDVVNFLLGEGAEVNGSHTESCWSCLHQAVYKGHCDIVQQLVKVCNIEAPDDLKITPLFVAAQYGRVQCLQVLINAGANVNVQVGDLATPLLIASQEGHHECVDLLLNHGADPNMTCSEEWPQLPIHAAAEFGRFQVLQSLIPVTDRGCDHEAGAVSPLYLAVYGEKIQSLELLLKEGFSPDAQECSRLEMSSPLAFALSEPESESYRECVRLLVAAGATISEDAWICVFNTHNVEFLQLILQHRWIPSSKTLTQDSSPAPRRNDKTALKQQEVKAMMCVALNQFRFAAYWLPLLLKAGLEPSLLLHSCILDKVDGEVLNYLLEFINWSTLSPALKLILDQRREEKSWQPRPEFDHVPSLSHLCRLQLRSILGPDLLMTTDVVQQLPVPQQLHHFLQFRDIDEDHLPFLKSPTINPITD